jgi:hypothetical protein
LCVIRVSCMLQNAIITWQNTIVYSLGHPMVNHVRVHRTFLIHSLLDFAEISVYIDNYFNFWRLQMFSKLLNQQQIYTNTMFQTIETVNA